MLGGVPRTGGGRPAGSPLARSCSRAWSRCRDRRAPRIRCQTLSVIDRSVNGGRAHSSSRSQSRPRQHADVTVAFSDVESAPATRPRRDRDAWLARRRGLRHRRSEGNDLDEPNRQFTVTLSVPPTTRRSPTGLERRHDHGRRRDADARDQRRRSLSRRAPSRPRTASRSTASPPLPSRSTTRLRTGRPPGATGTTTPRAGISHGRLATRMRSRSTCDVREDTLDEINETFSGEPLRRERRNDHDRDGDDDHHRRRPRGDHRHDQRRNRHRGERGTVDAAITVTLSAASGKTVTVPYATAPLSATEGSDYEAEVRQPTSSRPATSPRRSSSRSRATRSSRARRSSQSCSPIRPTVGPEGTCAARSRSPTTTRRRSRHCRAPRSSKATRSHRSRLRGGPCTPLIRRLTFNYRTVADTRGHRLRRGHRFQALPGQLRYAGDEGADHGQGEGRRARRARRDAEARAPEPTTDAVVRTATGTIQNDDNNSKLSISDATADEPGTMTFTVTLRRRAGARSRSTGRPVTARRRPGRLHESTPASSPSRRARRPRRSGRRRRRRAQRGERDAQGEPLEPGRRPGRKPDRRAGRRHDRRQERAAEPLDQRHACT